MKILILLPLLKNSGPSNVVASLLNSHEYQNHEIILCSFLGAETSFIQNLKHKNIKIIELPGFSIKSLFILRNIIRSEKVDILHSHCLLPDIVAPFASLFTKCKTISTIHCDLKAVYNNEYSFYKAKLYYYIHNIFLSLINKKVSVSSSVQNALIFKSSIIYNGVKPRQITKKSTHDLNLIFAGRLAPEKNIVFLLKTIKNIQKTDDRSITLHIYGDGECYEQAAKFSSLKILIHGFNDDFVTQIPQNSIFVNPSLAEGMPMAVLEAIASGVPVALSKIPAHYEIKNNIINGVALFDFTQSSLLDAINLLTNSTAQVSIDTQIMTQNFNAYFSSEQMSKSYINEYKNSLLCIEVN